MGDDVRTLAEERVTITGDGDIVTARQRGRALAARAGFSATEATLVATAISELARNIVLYAQRGEIAVALVENGGRQGIVVLARDDGPGIRDVRRACAGGYSSSGGLGIGLAGARRLMDEFDVVSEVGKGTRITVKKWNLPKAS
jgi:serine/threonine-protein kinase RsbT